MISRIAAIAAIATLVNAAALPGSADVDFRDDALEKNDPLTPFLVAEADNLLAGQANVFHRKTHSKAAESTLALPPSDKPKKKHHHVPGQHHRDERVSYESEHKHRKHKPTHGKHHHKDKDKRHHRDHDHRHHDHHDHGHYDHDHDHDHDHRGDHDHDHDHHHDRRDVDGADGLSYVPSSLETRGLLEDLVFGYWIDYGEPSIAGPKGSRRIRVGKPSKGAPRRQHKSKPATDAGRPQSKPKYGTLLDVDVDLDLDLGLGLGLRDLDSLGHPRHFMHHDFDRHVDISKRAELPSRNLIENGIPGRVDIMGNQLNQPEPSKFASMVLTPSTPRDDTAAPFVLNASNTNSSTVYMVQDTELPTGYLSPDERAVTLLFDVYDPSNVTMVPHCAVFDPSPPKPAPMFVQSWSSVVEGPHTSRRFAYNVMTHELRPMYLTNATAANAPAAPDAPATAPAAPQAPSAPTNPAGDAAPSAPTAPTAPAAPTQKRKREDAGPQSVTMVFTPTVENILPVSRKTKTTAFLPFDPQLPLTNASDAAAPAISAKTALDGLPVPTSMAKTAVEGLPVPTPVAPLPSMFTGPGDSFSPKPNIASVASTTAVAPSIGLFNTVASLAPFGATAMASSIGPVNTIASLAPLGAASGLVAAPDSGNGSSTPTTSESTATESSATDARAMSSSSPSPSTAPSPAQLMFETYEYL